MNPATRTETDILGSRKLPVDALHGINTLRGVENFPFSGRRLGDEPDYVVALAQTKLAAARANHALGLLTEENFAAIAAACDALARLECRDALMVDMLEGSGGTSTNMNVNEVLANLALGMLGKPAGCYDVIHPVDHLNRGQSASDVISTALKVTAFRKAGRICQALRTLAERFDVLAKREAETLQLARTCLQDAMPMTAGQRFAACSTLVRRLSCGVQEAQRSLVAVNLGGTAIGTGAGAAAGYRERAVAELAAITGIPLVSASDLVDSTQNMDIFVSLSASLRTATLSTGKIANDLMILSSGPCGGIGEVRLPEWQAGSSMMPGKVNPVMPIALQQVAFAVAGNDVAIGMAANHGHLECNSYVGLIAAKLLESLRLVEAGFTLFAERCIEGLSVDAQACEAHLHRSTALAPIVSPAIGYKATSELVRRSVESGQPLADLLVAEGVLSREEVMHLTLASVRHAGH
ncbi:MAG: aspartate ammonia-lyase [Mesorhizobium amorphae]|nr:MAG: aspartate ammonia-lyase [Mesorhizobium amorphae]